LLERIKVPLETWLTECQLARLDSPLPLVVVREHWMAQLQQPALQRRFFGGGVQFATLMPMRAIPFKAVCLLGMNDGDYPRSQTPRDFDLMSEAAHTSSTPSQWRPGDRSRREDDRYLFLEALLSAREKLYISWQGRRTTDHELKPPSVLVAQLMDYLNTVWTRNGKAACEAPLQPLQAFSPKYFTQGSGFQTYASDWQHALTTPTAQPQLTAPDQAPPSALTLKQLQRLLKQPVEVFLVDRLQLRLDRPDEATAEVEPFALNGLEKYTIGQRIAHTSDTEQALMQLHLGGQLALAGFGEVQQNQFLEDRKKLRDQLEILLASWPHVLGAQSAHWQLGDTHLSAEWANSQSFWYTNATGDAWLQVLLRPGSVTEGKKEAQQARLDILSHLWLNHLAACASGTPTTSVQIGLDAAIELKPIEAVQAQMALQHLCHLYAQAWMQPLPVAAKTSCAYAMAVQAKHKDPLSKAKTAFDGAYQKRGEYEDAPALQRVFTSFNDVADHIHDWSDRLYGSMGSAAKVIHLRTHTQEVDA
jgi:exodeoxyribonuclease V gamma subunit